MNENVFSKLCAGPQRWLFVAVVTLVIAVVSLLPQVDEYFDARTERAELLDQLDNSSRVVTQLPKYERLATQKNDQLLALKQIEVERDQTPQLRSWLVTQARQAGCQIRRIDFNPSTKQPWNDQTDPIAEPSKKSTESKGIFDLEKHPVILTVTGSPQEINSLIRSLDEDQRVKHTQSIELKPVGRKRNSIQLDLTLWYYSLVKATT